MALTDINFTEGDNTFSLEIAAGSLNAPVDIEVTAGAPNGLIDEIAAGSRNPPTSICNNKMQIIEVKRADCFAS